MIVTIAMIKGTKNNRNNDTKVELLQLHKILPLSI